MAERRRAAAVTMPTAVWLAHCSCKRGLWQQLFSQPNSAVVTSKMPFDRCKPGAAASGTKPKDDGPSPAGIGIERVQRSMRAYSTYPTNITADYCLDNDSHHFNYTITIKQNMRNKKCKV
jgi:hypothetical protein